MPAQASCKSPTFFVHENYNSTLTSSNDPSKSTVKSPRTGFAAESGQIRKNQPFSHLRGLNLCTSHILVFGCLRGQDVVGSKVAGKIPGTKITQLYLRCHLHRFIKCRRHLCPKSPETFDCKLRLFWLKDFYILINGTFYILKKSFRLAILLNG